MKSTIHLAVLALGALIQPLAAQSEVVLFDNVPIPLSWENDWVYPQDGDSLIAQPFITGALGLVSSVSVPLASVGTPSGFVPFEIWDNNNGTPGTRVASIGEVDLSALKPVAVGGQLVTFNTPVTGLSPNSTYYVVADVSNTDIDVAGEKTYRFLTSPDDSGVRGAPKLQAIVGGSWIELVDLLASASYRRMIVIESSDDLPTPLEITSIVRTEDSTTLKWPSQSEENFVVEFSPDLSDGTWQEIDDSVVAAGDETSYADSDPERLMLTEGFYRVRKNN